MALKPGKICRAMQMGSLTMIQKLMSQMRRCCEDYAMIQDGDHIAVGLSGGKDSLVMLAGLAEMRRFYPKPYTLEAITVSLGIEGVDYGALEAYCASLGVRHTLIQTRLNELIFVVRKESNPCALCSKMRKGALNDAALELGCNKVALGHNRDDAVETFVMNQVYGGRIGCFLPVTYLSRKEITVIRPLLYVPEKMARRTAAALSLPIVENPCPANGTSSRAQIAALVRRLNSEYPGYSNRIFGAMQRMPLEGWGKLRRTKQEEEV